MKIKLAFWCALLLVTFAKAQIYTPSGVIQGASSNNNTGIGTATPVGRLDIFTGLTGATSSIGGIPTGTFSFGNNGSAAIPTLFSKSSNSVGMSLFTGTSETNASPDMRFVVMEQTGQDYLPSNLTSTAFRFSRFNQTLVNILRNGNVGIGSTSPFGKLDVVGSKTSTYTSSLNSPTYDFLRIANIHGAGGSDQYSALALSVTGNTGANNAYVNLAVIQPVAGNSNSEFALTVRQASGVMNEVLRAKSDGKIGIGTSNPTSKLTVAGDIHSREVRVSVDAGADFVFRDNYNLPSLDAVSKYIKENKHLPEIASADEMKEEGINLSEMNIKLLQKIEELTLYIIEQDKKTEQLKTIISDQNKRLEKLENK
jgi:hypothetical protein